MKRRRSNTNALNARHVLNLGDDHLANIYRQIAAETAYRKELAYNVPWMSPRTQDILRDDDKTPNWMKGYVPENSGAAFRNTAEQVASMYTFRHLTKPDAYMCQVRDRPADIKEAVRAEAIRVKVATPATWREDDIAYELSVPPQDRLSSLGTAALCVIARNELMEHGLDSDVWRLYKEKLMATALALRPAVLARFKPRRVYLGGIEGIREQQELWVRDSTDPELQKALLNALTDADLVKWAKRKT